MLFDRDPRRVAVWLVRILTNWEGRVKDLSVEEQNTVIWRIAGEPIWLGFFLGRDSGISFEEQVEILNAAKCVSLAIPKLHALEQPMENGYFMRWDILAKQIATAELAAKCLQILEELSLHPDKRVQYAALHGLGHLGYLRAD